MREKIVLDTLEGTFEFAVDHFIKTAKEAIAKNGTFKVALSGGSTPKAIYERLAKKEHAIDWSLVYLFWSDERAVPNDHPDSNYRLAMESGLKLLPIPKNQIFPMMTSEDVQISAERYNAIIVKEGPLDLVMLGIGEDGHTASLFPNTLGLLEKNKLVIANFLPEKNIWRITLTFQAIEQAKKIAIYVTGASKADIVNKIFKGPSGVFPAQEIENALFILDKAAASRIE